jgi:hypothetical protein
MSVATSGTALTISRYRFAHPGYLLDGAVALKQEAQHDLSQTEKLEAMQ